MRYIVDNYDDVNATLQSIGAKKDDLISAQDRFNMELTLIVLGPIAIAIDKVQSESFTVTDGCKLWGEIKRQLEKIQDVNCPPGAEGIALREALKTNVGIVLAAMKKREGDQFVSQFTNFLQFLNPQSDHDAKRELATSYVDMVEKFVKDSGLAYDRTTIKNVISEHINNMQKLDVRNMDLDTYLEQKVRGDLPLLHTVYRHIATLLLSEAAVERAFHTMAMMIRPERSTMSEQLINDLLFVKHNYRKCEKYFTRAAAWQSMNAAERKHLLEAEQAEAKRKQQNSRVWSLDVIMQRLSTLQHPTAGETKQTRTATKQQEVLSWTCGTKIWFRWEEGKKKREKWDALTVFGRTTGTPDNAPLFTLYDPTGTPEASLVWIKFFTENPFSPLGADKAEWRPIHQPPDGYA